MNNLVEFLIAVSNIKRTIVHLEKQNGDEIVSFELSKENPLMTFGEIYSWQVVNSPDAKDCLTITVVIQD